ncbi:MAG: AraC family transcriptional regulator [Oscillospiraceae bacterium]|jgi:AraC-like DNA-binding protein|nr:AraC family transcriptional regulator [Oscillospiraceae bacterium]
MYKHELVKNSYGLDMLVNIEYGNEGISCAKHWHEHLEIIYILKDNMQVAIGDNPEIINRGDFVIINPMEIHSTETFKGKGFMLLQIPFDFLLKYIPDISKIRIDCDCKNPNSKKVKDILAELAETYETKKDGYLLNFYALLFKLLYTLLTEYSVKMSGSEYGKSEKYMERLTQILNYINMNYAKDCTMQQVAKEMNLNSSYFSRFFKKYMGMTFMEYLQEIRIEHVFQDMLKTDYNITDICQRNGFANYRIFSIKFKDRFGCTPGKKLKELRDQKAATREATIRETIFKEEFAVV